VNTLKQAPGKNGKGGQKTQQLAAKNKIQKQKQQWQAHKQQTQLVDQPHYNNNNNRERCQLYSPTTAAATARRPSKPAI